MAMSGQLEFLVEIKSPGSVFFEIYGSNKKFLPKICSDTVPRIDLLEGDWGQVGCIMMIYHSIEEDGKVTISKELIEAVDEKNKSITYNILEGDLMKLYKTLKIVFQIISKNEVEFVKVTVDYEKMSEDVPCPDKVKDFVTEVAKTIDAHYRKASNH